jgi:hypothetical protein
MKKVLLIFVFIASFGAWIYTALQTLNECTDQKEFIGTFWVPKNTEVTIGQLALTDEEKADPLQLHIKMSDYRSKLPNGKHYVYVDDNKVSYKTTQDKFVITSESKLLGRPFFGTITDTSYIGNGQVKWEIVDDQAAQIHAVLMGTLAGLLNFLALYLAYRIIAAICRMIWASLKFIGKAIASIEWS